MIDLDRFVADDYDRVLRSVAIACGNGQLAAEAVHEAIARAIEADRRGQRIEVIGAWVTIVAIRWTHRWHRRRRTEEACMLRLQPLHIDRSSPDESRYVDLRRAVAALPLRQRQATVLHYLHDLDVAATAAALGVSTGTVKTALARARTTLGGLLENGPPRDKPVAQAGPVVRPMTEPATLRDGGSDVEV